MITFEVNSLLDSIWLFGDKWLITQDGIQYTFNPQTDILLVDGVQINTVLSHQAFKQIQDYFINKHKFKVKVKIGLHNNKATAWYNYNNQSKKPLYITICLNYLKSIDNWKFVLGHEAGHFEQYLSNSEFNFNTESNLACLFDVSFLTLQSIISGSVILFLTNYAFSLPKEYCFLFLLSAIALFSFGFELGLYHAYYLRDIISSHQNEYKADMFSFNFFPDLSLKRTFLIENSFRYGDTHPPSILRLFYLRSNIKILFPIMLPYLAIYSFKNWDRINIPHLINLTIKKTIFLLVNLRKQNNSHISKMTN